MSAIAKKSTPEKSKLGKGRFSASALRKTKLASQFGIVGDPILYMNNKLVEIRNGYKSIPNYLRPVKADGVN